ncbi:hypothetical protein Cgig2_019990 [Carnegiea gigantea]|uniref:Uncharacterized protein n=1 Tax=Carnegiea gigantea TaxID=171969 RepID=A0A9Q1KDN6_9CARY|nr:hypothetical protein Cgig2_019990 [Carnegiea gigantea]
MKFEEAAVKHHLQNQSNHCPLLIAPNGFASYAQINHPFRFQAAWLSYDEFSECLAENWRYDMTLYPILHHMAEDFDKWNEEIRAICTQQHLAAGHNRFLIKLEARLHYELDEVLNLIEALWFQKSKIDAIRDIHYFLYSILHNAHKQLSSQDLFVMTIIGKLVFSFGVVILSFERYIICHGSKYLRPKKRGFMNMRQVTAAFMAKLGWRLVSEHDSLWSRLYVSNALRSIMENTKFIKQDIRTEAGNGRITSFWNHSWALLSPLNQLAIDPSPPQIKNATVAKLWSPQHG